MIAKMGQTVTIVGAKVVTGYADVGFDVDIGLYFKLQLKQLKQAIEMMFIFWCFLIAAGHKTWSLK
jgi:methylmalonyl-CoA mutase